MLSARKLRKNYADFMVLSDIDLDVEKSETFAVIGPNGAGKTTMFKVLTGEILPDGGEVRYEGRDITRLPPQTRAKMGFGRTFQIARVLLANTVMENLLVATEARYRNNGLSVGPWYTVSPSRQVRDEAEHMAATMGLSTSLGVDARHLSHGDKKRLEIAAMLCLQPRILMLDEPTAGMSPAERHRSIDLIQRLKQENDLTIMLTEHDMDVVFGLSDRVLVLNFGRVVACDTPQAIRRHPEVRAVYLGKETS